MDVAYLLGQCELQSVRCFELRGELRGYDQPLDGPELEEADISMNVHPARVDAERVELWFRLSLQNVGYVVSATCSVDFSRESQPDDEAVDDRTVQEFIEKVGVMTAYPYLRAQVARLASDMDYPMPTLPLLRAGQFRLPVPTDGEQQDTLPAE